MNKFIGIIPARYSSSRFPGKPLAMLGSKTVIERVYNKASEILKDVVVATDDCRIFKHVSSFGGKAVMTSPNHASGTDRVCEAFANIHSDANVIINIQGDEPFIHREQIKMLMEAFNNKNVDIATLARRFDPNEGITALANPNLVKVTFTNAGKALYFSRSVIPYVRGCNVNEWLSKSLFFTHIGIYAYRADVLSQITSLKQSPLEVAESLEQLRWLENGYNIHVSVTDKPTIGIDTPEDLKNAEIYLNSQVGIQK
ncbi:MAG: 3-deoxy-manno-octulosonate cytidylyltransferase [Muribaculaceae bacterium]|nr:3-deoxy-manno-octulosonate cytidylyltransferase [Muribaculaceae bacterium]